MKVRLIAEEISKIIIKEYPIISSILHNFEGAYHMPILDRTVLEKYGLYEDYMNKKTM